ncbi:MAG: lipoprotein-releasing system ATP-binding protein LolD [Candidatus Cloacimonadota bacterium]|nr:MAG: lipoprotein-releasing system ATP-binding protein LolD [Candidatus Cloacimonadota bacterium]
MSLIRVEKLKKSYNEASGKLEVLRGVDLEIQQGEMIAITGESGSGKSTLLHMMGMLDSYDSGNIYYSGKQINPKDKDLNEFRNKRIGFVFQSHYLLEDFTAEENVAMPKFLATKDFKKSVLDSRKLLKALDLDDRRSHYPNQLSGGEQQRVAVARSLINSPEIIFADEPTGNLDSKHSDELINMLMDLNKKYGQTLVIATHNKEIAGRMDRCFILENGILKEIPK